MAGRCDACGTEEYMPFVCKFCRGRYCVQHRLPENHGCAGLGEWRERVRKEGRLYVDPEPVQAQVTRSARAGASVNRWLARLDGKVTYVLLGLIVFTYLAEIVVAAVAPQAFRATFVLGPEFWLRPWTIVTSIFAHDLSGFTHIFVNGITLFFFGPTLESLLGSRRFLGLFLAAGVVAGLAEVVVFDYLLAELLGGPHAVLGASGAIMGLLGTLTVLAPRLTVLVFFVIPAPLWVITGLYALFDIALLGAGDRIAHLAHLAGLAMGLAYGKHLHDQGLRARVAAPAPAFAARRPPRGG